MSVPLVHKKTRVSVKPWGVLCIDFFFLNQVLPVRVLSKENTEYKISNHYHNPEIAQETSAEFH